MAKKLLVTATGRRKQAIARVRLQPGNDAIVINHRDIDEYFGRATSKMMLVQTLEIVEQKNKVDIDINICGGELSDQANAIRHNINHALTKLNPKFRPPLKKADFLTHDTHAVKHKKYNH